MQDAIIKPPCLKVLRTKVISVQLQLFCTKQILGDPKMDATALCYLQSYFGRNTNSDQIFHFISILLPVFHPEN